jgi:large subunit ribosomal protein L17
MRHRVARRKLGRRSGPRQALLSGLVAQVLRHERVTTTEAKAREVQSMVEKAITKGKSGTLHGRRTVLTTVPDKDAVSKLFDEIGPRYADRKGGYTRITKLSPRQGDSAPMALLELV